MLGLDTLGVVDNELGVQGLAGLRVVVAWVLRVLVSGNTTARVILIAVMAA
jgi:choline dehydrogenase